MEAPMTAADVAYVEANYASLDQACAGRAETPERGWRARLRTAVDELDELERPFAPNYDRGRWGPSSRDRCITAPRERYPEIFAPAAAGSPSASSV